MDPLSADAFVKILALVGVIIIVAALLSGLVDRTGLPHVVVFISLGAVLGPAGLGLLDVGLDSAPLRVVATLSLVLVLFADAITIDLTELRRTRLLSFLVVRPGTIVTAALIGLAGWWLLGLQPAAAVLLGAALASTDSVLLRNVLKSRDLPNVARHALRIESGMNDAVLLPMALVAIAFLIQASGAEHNWVRFGIELFLLGPAAGVAVGLVAVATLDLIRRRIGVTRDYESIYAIGRPSRRTRRPSPCTAVAFSPLLPRAPRLPPWMSSCATASSSTDRPRPRWRCSSRSCCWAPLSSGAAWGC